MSFFELSAIYISFLTVVLIIGFIKFDKKIKKKIIIISIIAILLIIAVALVIIFSSNKSNSTKIQEQDTGISRIKEICSKLEENPTYTFKTMLNDENQLVIARKENKAYVEVVDEGEKNTYIVDNNNTTVLVDRTKKYYTYENNNTYLTKVTNNMRQLLKQDYVSGMEKIDNKEYYYEEYAQSYPFLINYKATIDESKTKTRLYFEGNNLKYIKTYIGDIEQLLKVEMSYNIDNSVSFEIPKEYNKG